MRLSRKTIATTLASWGYEPSNRNIMVIEDALEWEDAEDYDTRENAIESAIEDYETDLTKIEEVTK